MPPRVLRRRVSAPPSSRSPGAVDRLRALSTSGTGRPTARRPTEHATGAGAGRDRPGEPVRRGAALAGAAAERRRRAPARAQGGRAGRAGGRDARACTSSAAAGRCSPSLRTRSCSSPPSMRSRSPCTMGAGAPERRAGRRRAHPGHAPCTGALGRWFLRHATRPAHPALIIGRPLTTVVVRGFAAGACTSPRFAGSCTRPSASRAGSSRNWGMRPSTEAGPRLSLSARHLNRRGRRSLATCGGSPPGAAAGSPRPAPAGVMCVTPDSGSTACGRPAASSAVDSRSVCATSTLSSARPWMSISGPARARGRVDAGQASSPRRPRGARPGGRGSARCSACRTAAGR